MKHSPPQSPSPLRHQRQSNPLTRKEERRARLQALDHVLKGLFGTASMALTYGTTWELLVAVILSAQCTDKRVNIVTKTLFAKYRTLDDYVHADPHVFAKDIHSTGFFNSKTKHILGAAKRIKEVYGGEVPRTMEDMLSLPGVARKTANVVLGNAYGIVEGIAVDTHVKRFAIRYDLTDHTDPKGIERDLMDILPKEDWLSFTYRVIEYGRQIAPARRYDTSQDPLVAVYPAAGNVFRV
jgi:endonuclease III